MVGAAPQLGMSARVSFNMVMVGQAVLGVHCACRQVLLPGQRRQCSTCDPQTHSKFPDLLLLSPCISGTRSGTATLTIGTPCLQAGPLARAAQPAPSMRPAATGQYGAAGGRQGPAPPFEFNRGPGGPGIGGAPSARHAPPMRTSRVRRFLSDWTLYR